MNNIHWFLIYLNSISIHKNQKKSIIDNIFIYKKIYLLQNNEKNI
jgi:hypothetical protein